MIEDSIGKYDKEAKLFKEHFYDYRNKSIVIYGIGRRTLTLLPRISEYNVVGLLDRDPSNIGITLNNVPVITIEEAKQKADLIIINSDPTNYKVIYKRICNCGVTVFYSNGIIAKKDDIKIEKENDTHLWEISQTQIKETILTYDVVSFDVFDTLIERKTLEPSDVWELMDRTIKLEYGGKQNFRLIRQEAIGMCDSDNPTIDDIYFKIRNECGSICSDSDYLKQEELRIEENIITPRREFIELLDFAAEKGKVIILTTDMYLKKETILKWINRYTNCISNNNIFVSCELGKSKNKGTIWETIISNFKGKRILHIGDDYEADYLVPKHYGVDCINIYNRNKLLEMSGFKDLLDLAKSLEDRLVLGMISNRIFKAHYSRGNKNGKIIIDESQLGYCVFGPMILYYISCLIKETTISANPRIIFLARDGFFIYKDYEQLHEELETFYNITLPVSTYLPISRRMVLVAALPDAEAWKELLNIPFEGTYQEFLHKRFNVKTDERTQDLNMKRWNNQSIDMMETIIAPYMKEIKTELKLEKESYLKFLDDNHYFEDHDYYLMDLGCQGTNQYFLQKITKKMYRGRYFYANLSVDNSYLRECDIQAYFQKPEDCEGKNSTIRTMSAYLESFFTAPYGMLRYITESGEFVYEKPKGNQESFKIKETINFAAYEFIVDYIRIIERFENNIGLELIDELYRVFFSDCCEFTKDLADSFYFDNDMIGSQELKLIGE